MSDKEYKIIASPSLPRDPTFLQTAAWEAMQKELQTADPEGETWRENKVRNALTGYTIHIESLPGGPAVKIASSIEDYVQKSLREGDQPFQERISSRTREAIDESWSDFIRSEFTKWLPEIDGLELPEGETLETIASFDDEADIAIRKLFDDTFKFACAPDHDDFSFMLREAASSCSEHAMEPLREEIIAACQRLAPQDAPAP
ncbi:hypothetical protein [Acetobacter persici]|uniref:Uncharacterized protein n=1 Tax=Acetobacter persici TaxID=1076596 RepID=A0A1U9LIL0_9PROT|nr:hypothetical protein [Acetobacter persici]AQT06304.1 hypothetical protein A0U91_14870 [Acetobacter persici]